MKKITFILMGMLALALTACMKDTGSRYTTTFSRVVTIDDSTTPVMLTADCTGEVFSRFENLKYAEQLADFGLADAKRAEVQIKLDVDASYYQTLTMLQAQRIETQAITNTELTEPTMPFIGWQQKHLGEYYAPTVWVSAGYLNVMPLIPSAQSGRYHLTADSVAGDTLFFKLKATYDRNDSKRLIDYLQCYDLRTLRDTFEASPEMRTKMRAALETLHRHYRDSVRIVLTGDFIEYNYNRQGRDTIKTGYHITNYFKYNF